MFTLTITAVIPSSARALASGPRVDGSAGDEAGGEVERERLRLGVVAADERVLVRRLVGEARCGERVEAGDDRAIQLGADSLCDRGRFRGRLHSAGPEAELGADREHRRSADRAAQLAGGLDRGLRLDREQHEVDAADGLLVRGALGPERLGGLPGPRGVAGADRDLDPGGDEPLRHRLAEAPGAAHDGDLQAAAPSTVSARRRDAARSVISVCVTTERIASGPVGSASSTTSASISPS